MNRSSATLARRAVMVWVTRLKTLLRLCCAHGKCCQNLQKCKMFVSMARGQCSRVADTAVNGRLLFSFSFHIWVHSCSSASTADGRSKNRSYFFSPGFTSSLVPRNAGMRRHSEREFLKISSKLTFGTHTYLFGVYVAQTCFPG